MNQGHFIERTVQSVLAQDVEGMEYLVVDGGSTDTTLTILSRFGKRLRWVSERDEGQADAVNKGIKATGGEIIGWLNSDDIYYPGSLRLVVSLFKSHPNVDVIYGGGNHIALDDSVIEPYPTEPWDPEKLRARCFLCQPAVFFRRKVTERFGLLDQRLTYCMDYEFWLRLSHKGVQFLYVPEILAATRLHPLTKTMGQRMQAVRETMGMLHRKLGYVPDEWLLSYARVFLNRKGLRRMPGARPHPTAIALSDGKNHSRTPFGAIALAPLFAMTTVLIAFAASLRWNRTLSQDLIRVCTEWFWVRGRVLTERKHRSVPGQRS